MATNFQRFMKSIHAAKAKAAEAEGERFSYSIAAAKLGTTKSYLCGIVNGTLAAPSPKLVQKIARYYGVEPFSLLLMSEASKTAKKARPIIEELVATHLEEARGGA